jgi:hypothetical protein
MVVSRDGVAIMRVRVEEERRRFQSIQGNDVDWFLWLKHRRRSVLERMGWGNDDASVLAVCNVLTELLRLARFSDEGSWREEEARN